MYGRDTGKLSNFSKLLELYLQLKIKEYVEVGVKGWDFKGEEVSCCGCGKANVWQTNVC